LFVLLVADGWTTYKILKLGGVELNPVVRVLVRLLGRYTALVATRAFGLSLGMLISTSIYAIPALGALCVLYGYILWNNMRALKQQRTFANRS